MHKFSADWVFPIHDAPIRNGVVVADNYGKILSVNLPEQHDPASIDHYQGVLVPGFVNTHCHLELSHMLGKVDTGTGLIHFIKGVVTRRQADAGQIADAVRRAEAQMLENGIVAVGDISNTTDTFAAKAKGHLRYYTFVELFDFFQENGTEKAMQDWTAVLEQAPQVPGSNQNLSPHAPYSVSPALFRRIREYNAGRHLTISIHNQETPSENALFMDKSGEIPGFYQGFGIGMDHFVPTGKSSIYYAMQHLDPADKTLFVHNTLTTPTEIAAAHAWSDQVYWATCPNANLYIENRLPRYQHFIDAGARMTVGTDSLTSNWQLSILEELKTISRFQSFVPFETLLQWATLNGAQALGFDDTLGSFEVGKTPGILLLENIDPNTPALQANSSVKRLL